MGGSAREDGNVIIPETGAGKYWYVDPSAGTPQQPAQMAQRGQVAQSEIDHPTIAVMEAVQRMINRKPEKSLFDPMQSVRDERQMKEFEKAFAPIGREDVHKTISMDFGLGEMEVPAVFDNMTDYERNIIRYLPQKQWPKDILMKIEDTARQNLEQGMDAFGNSLRPQVAGF